MITITEMLALRGLDTKAKVKLVRHQDKRYNIEELCRKGLLEVYQSYQSRPVFKDCDFIVSFIGMERSRARFYGVYRVKDRKRAREKPLADGIPSYLASPDDYYYELEEVPGFDDLKGRVVIRWAGHPMSWHQWLSDMDVIEILPAGKVSDFPGHLDFVLPYDDLVGIINCPDVHESWHQALSVVAGVYLITDMNTGKQYVGSAYGKTGILGRWSHYARVPHGDNKQLIDLLAPDLGYATNFQFSILQVLPRTMTEEQVVQCEKRWKKKLGTRAFGLTSN